MQTFLITINSISLVNALNFLKKIKYNNFFFITKKKLITIIKSPFIFKKTRNQFFIENHKLFIKIEFNKSIISLKFFEFLIFFLLKSNIYNYIKVKITKKKISKIF